MVESRQPTEEQVRQIRSEFPDADPVIALCDSWLAQRDEIAEWKSRACDADTGRINAEAEVLAQRDVVAATNRVYELLVRRYGATRSEETEAQAREIAVAAVVSGPSEHPSFAEIG